jgi:hypothetical protein
MYDTMKPEKRNLYIEQIIRAEWEMLRSVEGICGKSECQEEWPTFHIMRYSYYFAWSNQMLRSYMRDLDEAYLDKRNMISEKYAYMMEYTDPAYYAEKLEPYLPKLEAEARTIINEIAEYMIRCERELAQKYPKLSQKGRPIEANRDNSWDTSAETYMKGELRTYSIYTLRLFLEYIRTCQSDGANFAFLVKEKMVKMYGYDSLEDAERKM